MATNNALNNTIRLPATFGSTSVTVTPINKVVVQTFTGSGTYTPTTGMVYCIVEIVGPGGGSGGSTGAGGQSAANGGGGGGGYCRKFYTAALIGANAAVVIGTLGAAGAAGNNAGGDGTASTFTPAGAGAVLTANGGSGSAGQNSTATINNTTGGMGGTATGGDVNIPGANGTAGVVISGSGNVTVPGCGGSSKLSNPSFNNAVLGDATASAIYGAGACGRNNISGANQAGIAGAAGLCIVTEFLSA